MSASDCERQEVTVSAQKRRMSALWLEQLVTIATVHQLLMLQLLKDQ